MKRKLKSLALLVVAVTVGVGAASGLTTKVLAVANTCQWTGATNNNFNTAGNWTSCGGTVPQTGDSLVFDNGGLVADLTMHNDITGLSVANITFQGSSTNYTMTIDGNALTLTGNVSSSTTTDVSISNDITLGGNPTLTNTGDGTLLFGGVLSGTHNVVVAAGTSRVELGGQNTFTGTVTVNSGGLLVDMASGLGNAANSVAVNDTARLSLAGDCNTSTFSIPNPIALTGSVSQANAAKLSVGSACILAPGGATEVYGSRTTADQTVTLTGDITLNDDETFGSRAKSATITGALSGSHKLTMFNTYAGQLTLNSSSNTSQTPNGTYNAAPITATLSDDQSATSLLIGLNAVITVDGKRGATTVTSGGTLMGSGSLGTLTVNSGGTVAPGHSPGCLTTGNLAVNGSFKAEIGGTTPCTGYDQMKVTGTVDLTGGTLNASMYNNFVPAKNQTYTIIDNDGSDAVTGTFANLAEGATFNVGGNVFKISYKGGDGNDVVLTVISVGTPNTGFALVKNNPLVGMTAMVVAGGAVVGLARRNTRRPAARRR